MPGLTALDQLLFNELEGLASYRKRHQGQQAPWQCNHALFNHQAHHRGQATTLLLQAGEDVGITDLIALIPNQD